MNQDYPAVKTCSDTGTYTATRACPRVLIIVDKLGWSYDAIARGIVRYIHDGRFLVDIRSIKQDYEYIEQNHADYDLIFAMGWTLLLSKKKKHNYRPLLPFLDLSKVITGIHSHRSWDDYLSQPDVLPSPPEALVDKLACLKGINIISKRLYRIFRDAGLNNIVLTENGVDTELFYPLRPVNTNPDLPLVIGFSGSKEIEKHDYLKGFSAFIQPLDQLPNVQLKVLGGRGETQVKREAMPALYNQIDLYICASSSEGFSQSVLEAAACGRGVISTRVGGCEDLILEGENGFFINRDRQQISDLITSLESDRSLVKRLGANNRKRVLEAYTWKVKVHDWLHFIESNLPKRVDRACEAGG